MVTTRSGAGGDNQALIPASAERSANKSSRQHSQAPGTQSPFKRRRDSLDPSQQEHGRKHAKTVHSTPKKAATLNRDRSEDGMVVINRAPVLQLWSACVAHMVYPDLPWPTCISAGSAISTICAVAKGRSIATVAEKDKSEAAEKRRALAKKARKDLDEIKVMRFKLKLKDGLALVGSEAKGKSGDEKALKKKFGDKEYEKTRQTMEQCLETWKDAEEDLNGLAFSFYEKFRPDVNKGQGGWGRKGELSLQRIKNVVGGERLTGSLRLKRCEEEPI